MPEAEHPEQHPRPDRPGRRLAGEPRAAAGVEPERREQRDLSENPDDQEEPLDAHRLVDGCLAEDGVHVDVGEMQPGRHRCAQQERGAVEPGRNDDGEREETDGAAQAGSIPAGAFCERSSRWSGSGRSWPTGDASG